ncbi:thiamin pyrophosphokinase 1-like [Oppia nitens]|uniref:thiamin pyrophosphokinase 1-like n=1 Tax=Oppia nitens TaxID=1686743 RepID=UPI0023D9FE3B|nr:thiamin pyrophosphokinase 1-like [Oppia nitens]
MAYKVNTEGVYEWTILDQLVDVGKYAVLLLNHSLDHLNGHKSPLFDKIWNNAALRVAVDGGSKYLSTINSRHRLPDIVSGDFDSISTDRLDYFRTKGVQVIETPDQNYTDFTKAVNLVIESNKSAAAAILTDNNSNNEDIRDGQQQRLRPAAHCTAIVAVWSSLGRIDQVMSNINTLYSNEADNGYQSADSGRHYIPIYLVQCHHSITWLLHKGTHVIDSCKKSKWCSLVPVGAPTTVTTQGFRWNLTNDTMSFGSLISTSNEFDENDRTVRVETDRPLLFSMDVSIEHHL